MEFHNWVSYWERWGHRTPQGQVCSSPQEFYDETLSSSWGSSPKSESLRPRVIAESRWVSAGAPYYSVYPAIVPPLLRLRLDFDAGLVPRLPLPAVAVRLPKGAEIRLGPNRKAQALLITNRPHDEEHRTLFVYCQFESDGPIECGVADCFTILAVSLRAGTSLEDALGAVFKESGLGAAQAAWRTEATILLRLACTLSLLGEDPEIIEPDVLNKDREKWARTHDPAIVERAVRRGKRGWLVGARLEVLPHVRRPHMALRWTGPGGKIPRIVPVKWSIVHRENSAARG